MPNNRIRPGSHQNVIVIEAGVKSELSAKVRHRRPRQRSSEGAADHRGRDSPYPGRMAGWHPEDERQKDRDAFQQQSDSRGRDYRDGFALLHMRSAKDEWIGPGRPEDYQFDIREQAHWVSMLL